MNGTRFIAFCESLAPLWSGLGFRRLPDPTSEEARTTYGPTRDWLRERGCTAVELAAAIEAVLSLPERPRYIDAALAALRSEFERVRASAAGNTTRQGSGSTATADYVPAQWEAALARRIRDGCDQHCYEGLVVRQVTFEWRCRTIGGIWFDVPAGGWMTFACTCVAGRWRTQNQTCEDHDGRPLFPPLALLHALTRGVAVGRGDAWEGAA
jgi:hypothetical protein